MDTKYTMDEAWFEGVQDPLIAVRLSRSQIARLARLIGRLAPPHKKLLCLRYGFSFSLEKIERETGIRPARETLLLLQDFLARHMNLGRPIAQYSWKQAVDLALLRMAERR